MTFDEKSSSYRLVPSIRLGMALLGCIAMGSLAVQFASLNFAWVCMVNFTSINESAKSAGSGGSLLWDDKTIQANVYASYYYGGMIVMILGGWLIDRFGCKITFGACCTLGAVATILTPISATDSYIYAALLRGVVGIAGAVMLPLVYDICSHWIPKTELAIAYSIAISGYQIGNTIMMMLAGVECQTVGWPYIFYTTGAVNLAFVIVWFLLYKTDPTECSMISEAEKEFILKNRQRRQGPSKRKVPWKALLTSMPVYSCIAASFSVSYIMNLVGTFTPLYLKEVLNMKTEKNGFLSALPFLSQLLGRVIAAPLSDRQLGFKSRTWSVKIFNTFGMVGSVLCTLCVGFLPLGTSEAVPVALFCGALFFMSFVTGGFLKSVILIAPQYSATIGALTQFFGYASTIGMSYMVGVMTPNGTSDEWHTVFYTTGAIGGAGMVFFLIFGKGELEPWANEGTIGPIEVADPTRTISTITMISAVDLEQNDDLRNEQEQKGVELKAL